MFSGIIEETGVVESLTTSASGVLCVRSGIVYQDAKIGDSIAVDGCCLTVVSNENKILRFDLALETLRRTTLGNMKPGDLVNLERSLKVGDRISGHFVTGHIDATSKLIKILKDGDNVKMIWQIPQQLKGLIVEKGSVTISGISLTVGEVTTESFAVYIIPHTWNVTKLNKLIEGSSVNLEVDILARYVKASIQGNITKEFLTKCGFA